MCYASQGGSQVFKGEGHTEPIRGYSPVFVTRNHSHKGGGGKRHSRTPLAMPLQVISQYPIKFWRTFNRNPLISPTSRIECRHKSDKFMEQCDEDFKSGLHFTKEDL